MKQALIHASAIFMGLGMFVTHAEAAKIKVSTESKPVMQRLGVAVKNEAQILKAARAFYSKEQFKNALTEYSKIPTSSDRWPIAKEEMGWSYFRMKEYQMAAAQTRSLTNAYVKTQIDLEPFLLQSLIQLKSCDYKAIFDTLESTKDQMLPYVSGMETLAKSNLNEEQTKSVDKLIENKTFDGLKPDGFHVLPRRFYLDKVASNAIKTGNRSALVRRLTAMAVKENERNHKILQHLHLVEIEAMQRAFIPNAFGGKQLTAIPNDSNLMIFNGDKELWADEVDKTQADIFSCESKTGRTL